MLHSNSSNVWRTMGEVLDRDPDAHGQLLVRLFPEGFGGGGEKASWRLYVLRMYDDGFGGMLWPCGGDAWATFLDLPFSLGRCFPEAGLGGSTEASTGGSSKGVQVAPCS